MENDVLTKIRDQLEEQNKNSVLLRDVIEKLSENIVSNDDGSLESVYSPINKQKINKSNTSSQSQKTTAEVKTLQNTESVTALTDGILQLTNILQEFSKKTDSRLSKNKDSEKSTVFDNKESNQIDKKEVSYENDFLKYNNSNYVPLKEQTGFAASMRRGVIDIDNEIPTKGITDKIGRGVGKLWASASGIDINERRKYAKAQLYTDQTFDSAAKEDETPLAYEKRHLDQLKLNLDSGSIDTKGVNHEKYFEQEKSKYIKQNRLKAIEMKDPSANKDYQKQLKMELKNLGVDLDPKPTAPTFQSTHSAAQQGNYRGKRYPNKIKNATGSQTVGAFVGKKLIEDDLKEHPFASETTNKPTNNSTPLGEKLKNVIKADTLKLKNIKVDTISSKNFSFGKNDVEKKASANDQLSTSKNLNFENVIIKTLTIQSLIKPDGNNDANNASDSTGNNIDIDMSRGKKAGKLGKLGSAARMLGKVAGPLAAVMAAGDGISGYMNASENLGIEGREATFGEKMSSAAGGIASGISFGLLDEKTASKGIAGFFGAGPEKTTTTTGNDSVSAKNSGDQLAMIEGRSVAPLPDQKQADLAAAKNENDMLKQVEKESESTASNVVINAPTNVSGGGNSMPQIPSTVRSTHNAYEKFVDRVFTAL